MISKKDSIRCCPAPFTYDRKEISIPAGPDGSEWIVMWVYIPRFCKQSPPPPSIVMANGLALPRSAGLPHIAHRFATAGYNVFLFDFRHLGDSSGGPRQLVSVTRQLEDYVRVLRYVSEPAQHQTQFGVHTLDHTCVVLWGWSNSGGHVSRLAGRRDLPALSAVIAIDPLCDGARNLLYHIRKTPTSIMKLAHLICGDLAASLIPGARAVLVPALGPGGFLASAEAERGSRQLTPQDGPPFINSVAARYGFDVIFNRASGATVCCPLMVSWSRDDEDQLIPSCIPKKLAEDARRAGAFVDVYEHTGDHFAIHFGGSAFEQTIERQLDFLARALGPMGGSCASSCSLSKS